MRDNEIGLTRRGFIEAATILTLAALVGGAPSEPALKRPEEKPLTEKEITELLLTTTNPTNSFEKRLEIARIMGSVANIAELVNNNGLEHVSVGQGSEQNGS